MAIILKLVKRGGAMYLNIPIYICKTEKFKHGDYFELEKDTITPTYNLKKIGRDNGSLEKGSNYL